MTDQWGEVFSRECFRNMSNYTMKAIILYLAPNFEKKSSEVHDLALKYLTNEPEPVHRIMDSQSLFY